MIDFHEVSFRNIDPSDYQEIEDMEAEHFAGDDDLIFEELESMFEEGNSFVTYEALIAEYKGKVAGYIIYMTPNDFPKLKHVMRCIVDTDLRRSGIGSALLDRIEPTKMGRKVTVEVPEDDYATAAFYKANKYVVVSVVPTEYDDETGEVDMEGFFILAREQKETMELSQRLQWRAK